VIPNQHRDVGRRRQSAALGAFAKERVITWPQPDIDASARPDGLDGKQLRLGRGNHADRADNQALEQCGLGQSPLYRNRPQARLELRIDATLDAGTCGHVEHRLTRAAICLSGKTHESASE
jgi:hypothetical protein